MTSHVFSIANKLIPLNWGYDPTLCSTTVLGGSEFQIVNSPYPNTIITNNGIPTNFSTVHIRLDNMTQTKFASSDGFTMMIHYRPSLPTDVSSTGDSWSWQRVFNFFTTGSVTNDIYYTQLGASRFHRFSNFNEYNNQQKHSTSPVLDRTHEYILIFRNYPRFVEPSWGVGNNLMFDAKIDVYNITRRELFHSGQLYSVQYRRFNGAELNSWNLGLSAYAADRRFRGVYYNFAGFTRILTDSQIGTVIRGFIGQEDIFGMPNPTKSLIIGPYIPVVNLPTNSNSWLGTQYWRQNEGSDIPIYDLSYNFNDLRFFGTDLSGLSSGIMYYPRALKQLQGIMPGDTPDNGRILPLNLSILGQNPDNTPKLLTNVSGFILSTPAAQNQLVLQPEWAVWHYGLNTRATFSTNIVYDTSANIYVSTYTAGTYNISRPNSSFTNLQNSLLTPGVDSFYGEITKYDPSGNVQWLIRGNATVNFSTFNGWQAHVFSTVDHSQQLAANRDTGLYVFFTPYTTGQSANTLVITDTTGRRITFTGVNGAIAKLTWNGEILWIRQIISSSYYIGKGDYSAMGFWIGFTINQSIPFRIADEFGNILIDVTINSNGRQLLLLNIQPDGSFIREYSKRIVSSRVIQQFGPPIITVKKTADGKREKIFVMADYQNTTQTQPSTLTVFNDISGLSLDYFYNHTELGVTNTTYTNSVVYYNFDIGPEYQWGMVAETAMSRFISVTARVCDLIYINRRGTDQLGTVFYHYGNLELFLQENIPRVLVFSNTGPQLFNIGNNKMPNGAYTSVNMFDISLTPLWSSVIDSVEDNQNVTIPAGSNFIIFGETPIPPRALSWDPHGERIFAVIPVSRRESSIRIYDNYTISAGYVTGEIATGLFGGGIATFDGSGKFLARVPYAFNGGILACAARYNPYTRSIYADVQNQILNGDVRSPLRSMRFQWSDDRFSFLFGYDSVDNIDQKSILMNYLIHDQNTPGNRRIPLTYYNRTTHRIPQKLLLYRENSQTKFEFVDNYQLTSNSFNRSTITTNGQFIGQTKIIQTISGQNIPSIAEFTFQTLDDFANRRAGTVLQQYSEIIPTHHNSPPGTTSAGTHRFRPIKCAQPPAFTRSVETPEIIPQNGASGENIYTFNCRQPGSFGIAAGEVPIITNQIVGQNAATLYLRFDIASNFNNIDGGGIITNNQGALVTFYENNTNYIDIYRTTGGDFQLRAIINGESPIISTTPINAPLFDVPYHAFLTKTAINDNDFITNVLNSTTTYSLRIGRVGSTASAELLANVTQLTISNQVILPTETHFFNTPGVGNNRRTPTNLTGIGILGRLYQSGYWQDTVLSTGQMSDLVSIFAQGRFNMLPTSTLIGQIWNPNLTTPPPLNTTNVTISGVIIHGAFNVIEPSGFGLAIGQTTSNIENIHIRNSIFFEPTRTQQLTATTRTTPDIAFTAATGLNITPTSYGNLSAFQSIFSSPGLINTNGLTYFTISANTDIPYLQRNRYPDADIHQRRTMRIHPTSTITPERGLFDYGIITQNVAIQTPTGIIANVITVPLSTISAEMTNYMPTICGEMITYSGNNVVFSWRKRTYSPANNFIYSLSGNSLYANTIYYSSSFEILRGISQLYVNPPKITWRGFATQGQILTDTISGVEISAASIFHGPPTYTFRINNPLFANIEKIGDISTTSPILNQLHIVNYFITANDIRGDTTITVSHEDTIQFNAASATTPLFIGEKRRELISWFSFNQPGTPFAIDNCGNFITGIITQPTGQNIITPFKTDGISGLAINLIRNNLNDDKQSLEIFGYPSKFIINISKPFTLSFWFQPKELNTTIYKYRNTRNTNIFEIKTSSSGQIIITYRDVYNIMANTTQIFNAEILLNTWYYLNYIHYIPGSITTDRLFINYTELTAI